MEIIVYHEWKKDIVDVNWIGDYIIALKHVVEQDIFIVFSAYAPRVGLIELLKVIFLEGFKILISEYTPRWEDFIWEDLNGHVEV